MLTVVLETQFDENYDDGGITDGGGGCNFDLVEVRGPGANPNSFTSGTATWNSVTINDAGKVRVYAEDGSDNSTIADSAAITLDDTEPNSTADAPDYANSTISVGWTATDQGCNGSIANDSVLLYVRHESGSWADSGETAQSGGSRIARLDRS